MQILNILAQTSKGLSNESADILVTGGALYTVLVVAVPILILFLVFFTFLMVVGIYSISSKMDTLKDILEIVHRQELYNADMELRAVDQAERDERIQARAQPEAKEKRTALIVGLVAVMILIAILIILINIL